MKKYQKTYKTSEHSKKQKTRVGFPSWIPLLKTCKKSTLSCKENEKPFHFVIFYFSLFFPHVMFLI